MKLRYELSVEKEASLALEAQEKYEALRDAAEQLLLDVEAGPARNLEALKKSRALLRAALAETP